MEWMGKGKVIPGQQEQTALCRAGGNRVFMAFLLKQKLLEDLWLCFALILGNISSNDFLVLCLAACRLVCSYHKSHSQDGHTHEKSNPPTSSHCSP